MYGRNGSNNGGGGVTAQDLAASMPANRAEQRTGDSSSFQLTPWVFVTLVAIYMVWAVIEQHERVRDAVSPSNMALNIRNFVAVAVMALLGIVILKVAFTKLAAWNVPGASQILHVVSAA